MKNKFIRLFASLCFTLFLVSCNQIVPEDEPKSGLKEGNVIISLKQNPAKTISPVLDGFSYLDVNVWTVTFRETSGKYKDIKEYFSEGTLSVKIPVGKFDVILEGSIQQSENLTTSIPYSYYGKSSFEITGDETSPVPVSVIVSPKKTTEGKGSFNYTLNIDSCPAGAELTSKLVPYGTSEKKDDIILETTQETTNEFTITGSDIPSGFYKLSILLTVAADSYSKDIFSTFDNLVEILDNIETSGSKDVTFVDEVDKTYYVTCSESAKGNGVFESMPGYYDRIFETNDTVATVNLKFVDDILNQPCPQIDVSKLQNKTYNLFNKDTLIYSISKDIETGINISENNENYKINLIDSVKLATGENTVVNYDGGNTLHLILGGGVSVKAPEVSGVIIYANEYNDYYAITKNPLVISSSDLRVTLNDGKGSENFTVLKKASTEEVGCYNYYFVKVNDTNVSISSNEVPSFTIVDKTDSLGVSDKTYYAGDTVTLKANASASFADGTTFIWYVNGIEQTPTTDELSLTFGEGDTASNNSVLCIASYNGEYRSVAVDIKAIEQVALLYSTNQDHTTTASFSIVSDTTTSISKASGEIISGDTISVIDSYIDSNQNIYTLYTNNSKYYYTKSVFTGVGYDTSAKVYEIIGLEGNTFQEIKLGDDGIVYLLELVSEQKPYNYKIWSITNSDSSDAGGTASLAEKLSFGKQVFTNNSRTTFFVDKNSDIYYIKETPTTDQATNTTTNKVELVKRVSGTETENSVCTIFDFSSGDTISTPISNSDTMITFENANGISCCPEFTDMRIINGKLYLLVRHLSKTTGNSYSTGCVICVDLSSSETTVSGWDINKDGDTNKYNSSTDSYSHELLTFYGPDKIVAIKPKKLLIADDGVEHEHGSGNSAKDKQRLVVFDLESNAITGTIEIPEGIEFSYYGNGYSFFY